jgi:hypothetical protein
MAQEIHWPAIALPAFAHGNRRGPPLLFPFENKDDWLALIGMVLCLGHRLKVGRKLEVVGALELALQLVRQFEAAVTDPASGRHHAGARISPLDGKPGDSTKPHRSALRGVSEGFR